MMPFQPLAMDPGAAADLFAGTGNAPPVGMGTGCRPGTPSCLCDTLLSAVRGLAGGGVPGIALSGGLDSSLLLSMLSATGPKPVPWILDDGANNPEESEAASRLCSTLSLEPNVVRVRQDELPGRFADAVRASGGLVVNARAVSKFLLFERAAEKGGVIFSGAGADEVLFGDPDDASDPPRWWERWRTNLEFASGLLKKEFREKVRARYSRLSPPPDPRLFRLSTETARLLLPVERGMPAALGLKPALPFLEPEVMTAALALGKGALARGGEGKASLRDCARNWLPEEMCRARKRAVVIPAAGMERGDRARWQCLFRSVLDGAFFDRFGCFDRAAMMLCVDSYVDAVEPVLTMTERALMSACSIAVLSQYPFPADTSTFPQLWKC